MRGIAAALLPWFEAHGRKDLPWQRPATPYRVWISEIMLQQTQVATVVPYFVRFMERFPDTATLAAAREDEVLHLWSGLGYYARARNLHRAALDVRDRHGGALPADIDGLQALPGIGRSTAGAILALAHGLRHAILDGNAKRVLARYHAVDGWPGTAAVSNRLWDIAEDETPSGRVREYTQAIMDLGATVCTRARPACDTCPLAEGCAARAAGRPTGYPAPRPRMQRPVRHVKVVLLRNEAGETLLRRRPPTGIWGGLWSLPEPPADCDDAESIRAWCRRALGLLPATLEPLPPLRHELTHFTLVLEPFGGRVRMAAGRVEENGGVWYNHSSPGAYGLAAPIRRLVAETVPGQ